MALARFVLTADVTVPAGTPTGGAAGSATTPGSGWSELWPVVFRKGTLVWADSSAGSNGAQLLYQALSASLTPYIDGTNNADHFTGVSN
jgi:hypothetical protein